MGIFRGVLPFLKKKSLAKKLSPSPPKSLFENTIGIKFFVMKRLTIFFRTFVMKYANTPPTPSVHRISLPQDFPSSQLSTVGLSVDNSPYLWYWIVVANYGGGGGNRVVTELSFGHITTKTWAYSGVLGFFRKQFGKKLPPPIQINF